MKVKLDGPVFLVELLDLGHFGWYRVDWWMMCSMIMI